MTGQSPWSVKGVRPRTREAAKDLARREGLTLGEWLNRLIGEEEPASAPAAAAASVLQPFPGAAPANAAWAAREHETHRLTHALEALTRRLETAGVAQRPAPEPPMPVAPAAPLASTAIDRALDAFAHRLDAGESRTQTALGRFEANLGELRQTQSLLAERLRRMEVEDPQHGSLAALRSLESAVGKLASQIHDGEGRVADIAKRLEAVQAEAAARTGAEAGEAVARLNRIEDQVGAFAERLGQTAQSAFDRAAEADAKSDDVRRAAADAESALAAMAQRVAAAEAAVQATHEQFAEAMVDLSARLTALESVDPDHAAKALADQFQTRLADAESRAAAALDEARADIAARVDKAVGDGFESRFAEVATVLASRLDASERRNGDALEKVGAQVAKAAAGLDQRLRRIEERDAAGKDAATATRLELARITRAIDERLLAIEKRESASAEQAGALMERVTERLTARIEQSEQRSARAMDTVGSQMAQLAERLQARQDEANRHLAGDLSKRIEDADERAARRLEERVSAIGRDIRDAEDRAKAMAAPLQRGFTALVDRIDQVEARGVAPYAETVEAPGHILSGGRGDAATGFFPAEPIGAHAPATRPLDPASAAFIDDPFTPPAAADGARRPGGFASPFASGGDPWPAPEAEPIAADEGAAAPLAPLALDLDDPFAEDPRDGLAEPASFPIGPALHDDAALPDMGGKARDEGFGDSLDDDAWLSDVGAVQAGSTRNDFLANARKAAIAAAAARESSDADRKKAKAGGKFALKRPGKAAAAPAAPAAAGSVKGKGVAKDKKAGLSPVGVAAAAALVVVGGAVAIQAVRSNDAKEAEKPAALTPPPVAAEPARAPEPVAALPPLPVPPEAAPEASTTPPVAATPPEAAPTAPPPPVAKPVTVAPKVETKAPEKPAPRPAAERMGSPELRRLAEVERQKARQARERADAVAARPTARPAAMATPAITGTPAARVPAETVAPRTPAPRVASAENTPAPAPAPARATAAPTPAAASAPPAQSAATLYAQAVQRQQAGDAAAAAQLMRRASDAGDARATNRLAKMYERGEGVPRDLAQARRLTEQAAARGSRQALHNLGVYYAEGEGATQDFARAAENFRGAARKGVTDSQFNLGAMAEQGLGTPKSDREAFFWYSLAGRGGDRDAANKAREVGARLPPAERAAEEQRAAGFRIEPGGVD
jgi:localization factor PodJL